MRCPAENLILLEAVNHKWWLSEIYANPYSLKTGKKRIFCIYGMFSLNTELQEVNLAIVTSLNVAVGDNKMIAIAL